MLRLSLVRPSQVFAPDAAWEYMPHRIQRDKECPSQFVKVVSDKFQQYMQIGEVDQEKKIEKILK